MPARRVAKPYLINDGYGTREMVCHRYVRGGVHRIPRTAPRSLYGYVIAICLAAMPLVLVLTLPQSLLPSPFPGKQDYPGGNTGQTISTAPRIPAPTVSRPRVSGTTTPAPPSRDAPSPTRNSKAPVLIPPLLPSVLPSLPLPKPCPSDTPSAQEPMTPNKKDHHAKANDLRP
jgi:hypothetical protein